MVTVRHIQHIVVISYVDIDTDDEEEALDITTEAMSENKFDVSVVRKLPLYAYYVTSFPDPNQLDMLSIVEDDD